MSNLVYYIRNKKTDQYLKSRDGRFNSKRDWVTVARASSWRTKTVALRNLGIVKDTLFCELCTLDCRK